MLALRSAEIEEAPVPSHDELMATLRQSEEKSRKLKQLLQNQYSKLSRQMKHHQQTVDGFQFELERLKKQNETLLTEQKALRTCIGVQSAEIRSKNDALQSAVMDVNFFEVLLSSRDKTIERLENEKKETLKDLITIKSQLAALTNVQ